MILRILLCLWVFFKGELETHLQVAFGDEAGRVWVERNKCFLEFGFLLNTAVIKSPGQLHCNY